MKTKIFNHSLLRLVLVGVVLMGSFMGYAQKVKIDNLYYVLDNSNLTANVTCYKEAKYYDSWKNSQWIRERATNYKNQNYASGDVVIPQIVIYKGKTYSVVGVNSYCFENCKNLASVSLPNSIKNIGKKDFKDCVNLGSINIPIGLEQICTDAFEGCRNLPTTYIGHIFFKLNRQHRGEFQIPSGIQTIVSGAFDGCNELTSVSIPSSVFSIGKEAFSGCNRLESVIISDGVDTLKVDEGRGEGYRYKCTPSLYNPSGSAFSPAEGLFQRCPLKTLYIGRNIEGTKWGVQSPFVYIKTLEKVIIGNSVTSIGYKAFYGCTGLKTVKGLNSKISIGGLAFYDCPFDIDKYRKSFDYHANSYILPRIKEWQQKRDFETTAQYQARVTKENQEKKIAELMQEAIKDYTKKNPLKVDVGAYDADYELYALNSNYGKKHVKIPLSEAPKFREDFKNATFTASYIATEDGLQINDLDIALNGKTYHAEQSATELAATTLDIDLPEVEIPLAANPQGNVAQQTPTKPVAIDRSIDQHIPTGTGQNAKTFAVIIGNEKYTQVAQVPYAQNDAKVFAEYCKRTLGLPDNNVKVYENATYGTMIGAMTELQKIARAFKGDCNFIFYYAGHGIPDEETGEAYLLPIDGNGLNTEVCYPLNRLYRELGELQSQGVAAFIDACFSGAQRGNGMVVAARGVAIKAKANAPTGKTVVFSAATDKQTALPFTEKGHGMFTYYLLKKLQETKGEATLGELGEYVCDEVAKQAIVTNGKEQTPVVLASPTLSGEWKNMKLK